MLLENKKGTILYQQEKEKQSGQLTVHVLFLITVEVSFVCLWMSKDVACYNCRHWFYEGGWGWNPQKIKCVYNTFLTLYAQVSQGLCMHKVLMGFQCMHKVLACYF